MKLHFAEGAASASGFAMTLLPSPVPWVFGEQHDQ